MGTKLQFASDLLATKSFIIASDLSDSMEKEFEQRSIEAVKKTMLKQEETFKQQVMELHRLYSVQRMLMDELKNEINEQRKRLRTTATTSTQGTVGLGNNFHIQNAKDQHAYAKGNVGFEFDIIRPGDLNSLPGPSRIGGALEEDLCGVDLTLSIGGSKKRLKESQPYQSSDATKSNQKSREDEPSLSMRRSSAGTTTGGITMEKGEEKKPPWSLL